jgi:E3 ubiquitin-protein ligase MUL1
MCVVCLAKPYCIIFEPCNHVCVCEECSLTIDDCPFDRNHITLKKKVYLPWNN